MAKIKSQLLFYQSLDNWFYTPQGLWAAKILEEILASLTPTLQGHNFLQIGHCGANSWLQNLNFSYKWIVSPVFSHLPDCLVSSLTQLPLERNSIDCLLAPLTLEFFPIMAIF